MKNRNDGFFEAALSSIGDAVLVIDKNGFIGWINQSAENFFGKSFKQMKGKPFTDILPDDSIIESNLIGAITENKPYTDHDTIFDTGPPYFKKIPVSIAINPIDDSGIRGHLLLIRDNTALKSLERFTTVSEKLSGMGELSAGIAHEIKNPLGGIRGAAQLIEREVGSEYEDAKECADLIVRESDRIDRLLTDFIELNHPKLNHIGSVNIYPLLDDAISSVRQAIEKKNVTILKKFDPSLPDTTGDRDRLLQVLLNLLKNSVEACRESGQVLIRTSVDFSSPNRVNMKPDPGTKKAKRHALILIEFYDEGTGISDEEIVVAFTPFYSSKKQGTGLGLPLSLHIARLHGGALELSKRTDGTDGTLTRLWLPFR